VQFNYPGQRTVDDWLPGMPIDLAAVACHISWHWQHCCWAATAISMDPCAHHL